MKIHISILLFITVLLTSCQNRGKEIIAEKRKQDSTLVARYIKQGDSIYAQKASYSSFLKSMELYDSAWQIAEKTNDTSMIAQAVYAKGRAYDAINNNPQKTIDYYTEAARLYATIPGEQNRALHIKHLVAHSYDKVQDSANCMRILKELYAEIITRPDSVKRQLRFTVEMALISTVIRNYTFADSILQQLTRREWIENDTTEYDYLSHFYVIKARIDALQLHNAGSIYLDSVEMVLRKSRNLNDSMYYSNELWELYKSLGNKNRESYYLQLNNTAYNRFNSPESVRDTKDKLAKMEVAAVEAKRKADQQQAKARKTFIYILSGLLLVISLLALFLMQRNKEIKRRKNELLKVNDELYQKNIQNELLNKELHHRVKNNLQMIMSLVYMQERNTDSDETKSNLQDIRLRIENIAALHKQLMEQKDETVDLKKYISQLVNSMAGLAGDNHHIFTYLDVESIPLPVNKSFPLGLIMNEWVTNSMKYARTLDGSLSLFITIKRAGDTIVIDYHDSGSPVRKEEVKSKLGLSIINLLTAQMNAGLTRENSDYFRYNLTIPLNGR